MIQYELKTTMLTLNNVTELLSVVNKLFQSNTAIEISLANVQQVDSAGIAFLLELKIMARKVNCQITLTHIPSIIDHLCQLYNINL